MVELSGATTNRAKRLRGDPVRGVPGESASPGVPVRDDSGVTAAGSLPTDSPRAPDMRSGVERDAAE